jgi:hypothetical protein
VIWEYFLKIDRKNSRDIVGQKKEIVRDFQFKKVVVKLQLQLSEVWTHSFMFCWWFALNFTFSEIDETLQAWSRDHGRTSQEESGLKFVSVDEIWLEGIIALILLLLGYVFAADTAYSIFSWMSVSDTLKTKKQKGDPRLVRYIFQFAY